MKTNRQDLRIEYLSINLLIQNPNGARIHNPKQVANLARSINKFDFVIPVIVDADRMLLSGHARVAAAHELGMAEVPTICVTHLSNAEKRAFMLADNRLAELGSWNKANLKRELQFLSELDIDFATIGFDSTEIDILLDEDVEQDQIAGQLAASAEQPPISKPGDVWKLGDHVILCGDALQTVSYEALLAGQRAQMVFTDSPYNVPINGHVLTAAVNKHREFAMANGDLTSEAFTAFLATIFGLIVTHTVDGAMIFACMDWRHGLEILQAGRLLTLKNICVWVKNNGGMGSLYRSQHEFVYVFKNGTAPHVNNIELGKHGRYRTNVWDFRGISSFGRNRDELLKLHPTVKPVALVADAIKDCSRRGDLILDPFGGSGTTLIAAEKTKRRAALIEIDPIYVDVAIRRWQKLTGRSATCATDGQAFAEREAGAQSGSSSPSSASSV